MKLRAALLDDGVYGQADDCRLSEGRHGDNTSGGALGRLSAISGTEVGVSGGWWMCNLVIFHSTYDVQKTYIRVTIRTMECVWVTEIAKWIEQARSQAIPQEIVSAG